MNLIESYLKEIHSVKPCTAEWTKEFPDREFVEVDVTEDCYGRVTRRDHVFTVQEWADFQEKGYRMT